MDSARGRRRPSRSSYSIRASGNRTCPSSYRQLVFPSPPCNLFGLTVGPAVAVLLAAVAFVQEALIGALELVVVRAEWTRAQQTLLFEVALGSAGVLAAVLEIAFGHDTEGADGGEHSALGAVDLVHAVAFSHRAALTSVRQVEILRETSRGSRTSVWSRSLIPPRLPRFRSLKSPRSRSPLQKSRLVPYSTFFK